MLTCRAGRGAGGVWTSLHSQPRSLKPVPTAPAAQVMSPAAPASMAGSPEAGMPQLLEGTLQQHQQEQLLAELQERGGPGSPGAMSMPAWLVHWRLRLGLASEVSVGAEGRACGPVRDRLRQRGRLQMWPPFLCSLCLYFVCIRCAHMGTSIFPDTGYAPNCQTVSNPFVALPSRRMPTCSGPLLRPVARAERVRGALLRAVWAAAPRRAAAR